MANEVQIKTYTTVNHIVDGSAVSAGGFSASSDVDTGYDNSTNLAPLANIILTVACTASAPTAGDTIDVYRRDMNIVSTNDETVPSANNLRKYMGSVAVSSATSAQYLQLDNVPLPPGTCQFYIQNNTSVAIASAAWDLDIQPISFVPAT